MNFFPFVPVDVSAMFSGLSVLPGPCPVSGEVFTHVVMQLFWGVLGCVFIGSPPHCTRGDRAYRVNLNPGMTGSLPYSGACGFALGFGEIQGTCQWLKSATERCGTFMHRPAGRMMRPHAPDLPDRIWNIVLCINEFKSQQFFQYLS